MKNQPLPYGLRPPEVAFLLLLAATYYFTGFSYRGTVWPVLFFGASLVGGLLVAAGRSPEEWRRLPNKSLFFLLGAAWVGLFTVWGVSTLGYTHSPSLFAWLMDIYTAPGNEDQYGLFIPYVVLGLYWWKRQELVPPTSAPGLWWPALALLAAGLFVHVAGFAVQLPTLSAVGFFIGLYALSGLAWGWHWLKASFFPYFLLGFCVPLGGLLDGFTFKLRLLVSWLVAGVAHLGLAPDLIREGTQLLDAQRTFAYEVAAACSGIRSFMALLALLTVYAFISFKSPWRRGAMMLAALPLAVIGNVARLCFTIGVAEMFGQNAGKAVETKFGFVTFVVALGCAYVLARWLEKGEPAAQPPAPTPTPLS